MRQRLKNSDYKRRATKTSSVIAHARTQTQTHKQCSESVHLSAHQLSSLFLSCRHLVVHCAASPAKHVLHRLGNKAVILPGRLSICYHLKTKHICIGSQRKIWMQFLKLSKLNPWIKGHLVVTAWVPVGGAKRPDGGARGGREDGGGEGRGDGRRDSLTAVHYALRDTEYKQHHCYFKFTQWEAQTLAGDNR